MKFLIRYWIALALLFWASSVRAVTVLIKDQIDCLNFKENQFQQTGLVVSSEEFLLQAIVKSSKGSLLNIEGILTDFGALAADKKSLLPVSNDNAQGEDDKNVQQDPSFTTDYIFEYNKFKIEVHCRTRYMLSEMSKRSESGNLNQDQLNEMTFRMLVDPNVHPEDDPKSWGSRRSKGQKSS